MSDESLFIEREIGQREVKDFGKVIQLTPQEILDKRYWRYKKKTPPKDTFKPKRKKAKVIDKRLFNEQYDHLQHIKSIRSEL